MSANPIPAKADTDQNTDTMRRETIRIIETTDVHGNLFPHNFITREAWGGSLARVATYVDSVRAKVGDDHVILLDNGDLLQGQPTVYYYNFIDTLSPHVATEALRYMRYDALTPGNHDIETGHNVYDRFFASAPAPVLGANIIDTSTGQPYLLPYTILERAGLKVAVVGMITPAIPAWLPENIWSGLRFDDMTATASALIPEIRSKHNPDIVVGLFHSGHDDSKSTDRWIENASAKVAREVDGFDVVFMGHDHRRYDSILLNDAGSKVIVLNPANNANAVADVTIEVLTDGITARPLSVNGTIADVSHLAPSKDYMARFAEEFDTISRFTSEEIGVSDGEFTTRDAFFGPSAFMTLLHRLQLDITGADISLAAPLSCDASIAAGPVRMSDMFTLYKYENMLYTMAMTGEELKNYLEMAYDLWINTLNGTPGEHLLKFASSDPTPADNYLANPSYNFDSAAGIDYTVDVTRPAGKRVTITRLSDGRPFDPQATYSVAVNSYRGNGGGELMTRGAGINHDLLTSRILNSTDKDLRYYLIERLRTIGHITPVTDNNWSFIPADIVAPAAKTDRTILFSPESSKNQK